MSDTPEFGTPLVTRSRAAESADPVRLSVSIAACQSLREIDDGALPKNIFGH